MKGDLDLDEAGHDIRVALCMSNTTADTETDKATISGFTTLDEMDGANYVRKALASQTVTEDGANARAEFDATDVTWTALGAGTRAVAGMLVYRHITNDTDSVPIAWIDTGGFPITANGGDLTVQWSVEGILQLT
jgi:hypothetical protein